MKISVITICYNCEKTIRKTVESVLNQTYKNYEYIIIDGSSQDESLKIISNFKSQITKIISEKDNGIYDAINKGISHSTGDAIVLLHGNDILSQKEALSKISYNFVKHQNVDVILSNVIFKKNFESKKSVRLYSSKFFKNWMLRIGYSPPHLASFFRSNAIKKVGKYNNDYKIAGDFDYFVRSFLNLNLKHKYIDENLIVMSPGGRSNRGIASYIKSSFEINNSLKKNGFYSNILLTFLRFPFKIIQLIFTK
jgi:glycosyltransferase involved in cell wall biosynthesis